MFKNKLLFLFLAMHVSFDYVQSSNVAQDQSFDVLIFTQQWPQTECKEWKQNNPSHTCNIPDNPDSWRVHGVWPTKLHTKGPAFCNRSWHFDPEAVKSIEIPLTELWTNIEGGTEKYSFWAHEWTKHGTCAAVLPPLNSEFNYFSNGLNWMKQFSMTKILASHNIIPTNDKEYLITDIHKAITDSLHVNPAIECRQFNGKSWLIEIRICFSKSMKLTDCDGVLNFRHKQAIGGIGYSDILTNCNVQESILYPKDLNGPKPAKRVYVQLYKLISWLQWLTL